MKRRNFRRQSPRSARPCPFKKNDTVRVTSGHASGLTGQFLCVLPNGVSALVGIVVTADRVRKAREWNYKTAGGTLDEHVAELEASGERRGVLCTPLNTLQRVIGRAEK